MVKLSMNAVEYAMTAINAHSNANRAASFLNVARVFRSAQLDKTW